MKLKEGFVLKKIAGVCVAAAADSALNLDGLITLNDTAKTMWLLLADGAEIDDLVKALTDEYEVSDEVARKAAVQFVEKLKELDILA